MHCATRTILKVVFVIISYLGSGKFDVYDGANASAPQLVALTTNSFSSLKYLKTSQRYMFIRFTTQRTVGLSWGFDAVYSSANASNTSGNTFDVF